MATFNGPLVQSNENPCYFSDETGKAIFFAHE